MFGPVSVRFPTSWEFFAQQEGSFCALLGFSILRFFASSASFSGLVCSAPQSFGLRTGYEITYLNRSVTMLVGSKTETIFDIGDLREK